MREGVVKLIRDERLVMPGDRVAVAISGGADSVALIHVMSVLAEPLGISICAAHFNHKLRGEESDRDEAFVRELCGFMGVELYCESALTPLNGEGSLELRARCARYEFYNRAKASLKANKIATAHTASDNFETILFNLIRGTGLRGLCGIPVRRDCIIRPMLQVTRREVMDYLDDNGFSYVEDSTNAKDFCTRNILRHHVIPVLKKINASAEENVSRAAELFRGDEAYLEGCAESVGFSASAIADAPPALVGRAIRREAKKLGYKLEYEHINDIIDIARSENPSARCNLPGGISVMRSYDEITFGAETLKKIPRTVALRSDDELEFGDFFIRTCLNNDKINNSFNTFCLDYDKICGKLRVRTRKTGDEIKLPNRPNKSLKKLFIDLKTPQRERDFIPIIVDDKGVCAVYGIGVAERVASSCGGLRVEITKLKG